MCCWLGSCKLCESLKEGDCLSGKWIYEHHSAHVVPDVIYSGYDCGKSTCPLRCPWIAYPKSSFSPIVTKYTEEEFMQMAYDEAVASAVLGEVPIGATLVDDDGLLVAKAGNRCIINSDPCAHAEINVLRQAGEALHNYRLCGCTIFVTLEPCVMCVGAMIHARIKRVVYGASDPKTGAIASKYTIGTDGLLNHNLQVSSGLMADECGGLLRDFFKARRKHSMNPLLLSTLLSFSCGTK